MRRQTHPAFDRIHAAPAHVVFLQIPMPQPHHPRPAEVRLDWDGKHLPPPEPAPPLVVRARYGGPLPPGGWRNRLIAADNRAALLALAAECAGQVACIYIDPPFATGTAFQTTAPAGAPQPAYTDRHGGLAPYLQMIYERLVLMRPLLAPRGSIFVHLDWHASHYVKLILDEVFGVERFRNEIIWRYRRWPSRARLFQRMHDTIFWYSASASAPPWHQLYEALSPSSVAQWGGKRRVDRRSPRGTRFSETGADPSPGVPMSDVWEVPALSAPYGEYLGYATQKPEALIERILAATTDPGDLVADFFCGAGTTPAVAERLGRRWIACDSGSLAVHLTRKRLLALSACAPFDECAVAGAEAGSAPAPDQPPIAIRATVKQQTLTVALDEATAAATDYWAVDFARDGLFCPTWHSFRTRKRPALETTATHTYPAAGRATLAVRLVDPTGQSRVYCTPVEITAALA
jgi:DNA modification methylase